MSALPGYQADIAIAGGAGTGTSFSSEATTPNASRTTYQITSTAKRYWDPTVTLTVETSPDNSNWTTITSGFQVAYAGGVIQFPLAQAVGTYIRVSGHYLAISALAQCKDWSFSATMDALDTTVFTAQAGSGTPVTAKTCIAGPHDATVTVSRYYLDSYFLPLIADPATFFVLVLYTIYSTTNANAKRIECIARMTGDSIKAAVSGVVEQGLTFKVTGLVNSIQAS